MRTHILLKFQIKQHDFAKFHDYYMLKLSEMKKFKIFSAKIFNRYILHIIILHIKA